MAPSCAVPSASPAIRQSDRTFPFWSLCLLHPSDGTLTRRPIALSTVVPPKRTRLALSPTHASHTMHAEAPSFLAHAPAPSVPLSSTAGSSALTIWSLTLVPPLVAAIAYGTISPDLPGWPALGSCAAMSALTLAGMLIGYGSLFLRRQKRRRLLWRWMLGIAGSMAAQGPLFHWIAQERAARRDSRLARRQRTIETTPAIAMSWLRAMLAPIFPRTADEDFATVGALACDPVAAALNRHYPTALVAGILLPGLYAMFLGGSTDAYWSGLLWGGLFRVILVRHFCWSAFALRRLR